MNNWKEAVSLQESDESKAVVMFITSILYPEMSGKVTLMLDSIELNESDFTETEDTIGEAVARVLNQFPPLVIDASAPTKMQAVDVQRERINVAKNSRRGVANRRWNNVWFYRGSNKYDSPIVVAKRGDRYAIKTAPNFKCYGFCVIDMQRNPVIHDWLDREHAVEVL